MSNHTAIRADGHLMSWDDATWVLTSSFVIFTMQSGFGLLESGMASVKNEVNIMVKNAVDVIFGGITFWMFGFGLAFGTGSLSNAFCGVGYFFVHASGDDMGYIYSWFFFQLSFSTTATTIVSGAVAERTRLITYIVFSAVNTLIYCIPAHWVWAKNGFLYTLGMVDIAGGGPVHLIGGITGLVATLLLGPRIGRFDQDETPPLGCPTNAILGTFMLWWGWLGFNCGSTFGISGGKWKLAARAAVVTGISSMSGGAVGFIYSYCKCRKYKIPLLINGILGSLVSCTAICALAQPWEAFIIGGVGAILAELTEPLLIKLKVDDPVGVVGVHAVCSVWGILSVGFFVDNDKIMGLTQGRKGVFKGGGWYLLGVQILGIVVIALWTVVTSFICLKALDLTFGLRVSAEEELMGADFVEHGIKTSLDVEIFEEPKDKSHLLCPRMIKFPPRICGCLRLRRKKTNAKKQTKTTATTLVGSRSNQERFEDSGHMVTGEDMNGHVNKVFHVNDEVIPNQDDQVTKGSTSSWL